jgi:hypothetical protein
MVDMGEDKAADDVASSPGIASPVLGAQRALATIFARGVLRVLAKRHVDRQTTCLSAASKPCLDTVNTERSR